MTQEKLNTIIKETLGAEYSGLLVENYDRCSSYDIVIRDNGGVCLVLTCSIENNNVFAVTAADKLFFASRYNLVSFCGLLTELERDEE